MLPYLFTRTSIVGIRHDDGEIRRHNRVLTMKQSVRSIEKETRVACYLDPSFAMPRLHLGMMADRAGDRRTASRELQQGLDLLKREDASRLLLFGGGFGREALMALCEGALRKNGARP